MNVKLKSQNIQGNYVNGNYGMSSVTGILPGDKYS